MVHARVTKVRKDETVFPHHGAMRRKCLILFRKHSTSVALFVEAPVDGFVACAGGVLLDQRLGSQLLLDEVAQIVGIIGGVRHDVADAVKTLDQATRLWAVAPLSGREHEADRQTKRVDCRMDLGGQAAIGATDGVSLSPPFAPLASAWALQIVESTRTYSKSGSARNSLKRCSQAPESDQRRKRCKLTSSDRVRAADPARASLLAPATGSRRQRVGFRRPSVRSRSACRE